MPRALADHKTDYATLTRATRCHAAAWIDGRSAVAHLIDAGPATFGRDADLWAREQFHAWIEDRGEVRANELADALKENAAGAARWDTRRPAVDVPGALAARRVALGSLGRVSAEIKC